MSNIVGIINLFNPRNKVSGVSVSEIEKENQFISQVEFGDANGTKTLHSADQLGMVEAVVWPYHQIGDQEYDIIVVSLWDTSSQLIASFNVRENPEGEGYRSELPQLGDSYSTHVITE